MLRSERRARPCVCEISDTSSVGISSSRNAGGVDVDRAYTTGNGSGASGGSGAAGMGGVVWSSGFASPHSRVPPYSPMNSTFVYCCPS